MAKFKTFVGIGGEQISVNPDNVFYVIENGSQGGVYIAFSKDRGVIVNGTVDEVTERLQSVVN